MNRGTIPLRQSACLAAALSLTLASFGCGTAGAGSDRTTLTVLAASSLTTVAQDLADAYEAKHPEVRLRFSLAGSQELASQVRNGVPADVIVTADEATMSALGKRVRDPVLVAGNTLVIVARRGNPKSIESLADLAGNDVVTVLAAPSVPAGRYARTVLDRAGVQLKARSDEPDVRAVLTRVRLGEADAGIVYATDASAAADDVAQVEIPPDVNVTARYPAAVLPTSGNADQAASFVDWLRGSQSRRILRSAGFLAP